MCESACTPFCAFACACGHPDAEDASVATGRTIPTSSTIASVCKGMTFVGVNVAAWCASTAVVRVRTLNMMRILW